MDMDKNKTGALIAAARKEKHLTQKELAKALHVSDRAVSKWERGAGFPDVSLLEPLADALDLRVLDLLRGEEQESAEPELTVRRCLVLLARQAREKTRRRWGQIVAGALALAIVGFVGMWGVLVPMGAFDRPVSFAVSAAVYTPEGEPAGKTTVTIDGTRTTWMFVGNDSFKGRFAIGVVEPTCREGAEARIRWDAMWEGAQDILFYRAGEFLSLGVERMLYITENMQSFGLRLEDGTIIATDPSYVPLLLSGYYYTIQPTVSNQF